MKHDYIFSASSDRPEGPPAWMSDVLLDLQKVADKRGMVRLSDELQRMRSRFPSPAFEK